MKGTVLEICWHEKEPVLSIHCSKQRFVTCGADNDIRLWSMPIKEETNKSKIKFIASLCFHTSSVNVVRFSPCENYISSGSDDGSVVIWKKNLNPAQKELENGNLEQWQTLSVFRHHCGDVYDLTWSPCGKYIATASIDNTSIIWDVKKAKNVNKLVDHKHYVQGISWDCTNNFIATQSSDRTTKIYKIKENPKGVIQPKLKANICYISMQLDNDTVIKKKLFADETMNIFFRRLCFSPDGDFLFTPAGVNNDEYCVYVFSKFSWGKPILCYPGFDKPTVGIRFCPILFKLKEPINQSIIQLPYRMVFAIITLNSIFFYDTQHSHPFAAMIDFHYASITDACWSPDGFMLFISSRDGYCSIIDFEKDEIGEPYLNFPLKSNLQSYNTSEGF